MLINKIVVRGHFVDRLRHLCKHLSSRGIQLDYNRIPDHRQSGSSIATLCFQSASSFSFDPPISTIMSRPELGRDESYNRIRIPSDLKSQICSQIADSSESLPLTSVSEDSVSDAVSKPDSRAAPMTAVSRFADSTLSDDLQTPTPEKPNPLEQVNTARKDGQTQGVLDTLNITPTQSQNLGPMINKLVTEDDSTLSVPSTAEDGSSEGKRPKMPGRPSTMKRIGSAIKRSISSKQQ
jgi:hypothetical protein